MRFILLSRAISPVSRPYGKLLESSLTVNARRQPRVLPPHGVNAASHPKPTSELGGIDHARNASPLRFQQIGHLGVRARRLRARTRQNRAREFVIGLGPVRLPPLPQEGPPREKLVRQAPSKEPVVASRRRPRTIGPRRRFGAREVGLVTVLPLPPSANCRICGPDVARHDKMRPRQQDDDVSARKSNRGTKKGK
ncbi:unnamed protein product [Musa acuminata subsp. burmannicoides]